MLETGSIARFHSVGQFSSYCRCVESKRISNGKKKGEGNARNGNKYLSWAFIEAAAVAIRSCPQARRVNGCENPTLNGGVDQRCGMVMLG